MRFQFFDTGTVAPWSAEPSSFLKGLASDLTWGALVLGAMDTRRPTPDGLLLVDGVDDSVLSAWCDGRYRDDPTWKTARRRGVAEGKATKTQPGPPLPAGMHACVHLTPATPDGRVVWYLAVGDRSALDPAQVLRAGALLRLVQNAFDHTDEPATGRALLDARRRLILADPRTGLDFKEQPQRLRSLENDLPAVVAQRWPDGLGDDWHDVFLALAGEPTWLRVRQCRQALVVELRPSGPDGPPAVGVVDDPRIATALAFLSDRYGRSPSLNEIADAVGASPFHFHRLFSRGVGVSPKHYMLRLQMQIAKWLLRATRRPVGQIAVDAGFSSHGHFTATFHRVVGVSPTTYRESP